MAEPTLAVLGSIIVGILALKIDVSFIKLLAALLVLGCLGWFGIRYAKWANTNFVVTSDRVIHRVGVIAKHGIEIPLERINTVFFNQSMFERLLGAGDLGIESAGERGAETFEDVRKPAIVQNEIYRQMEANSSRLHGGGRHAARPFRQAEGLCAHRQKGLCRPAAAQNHGRARLPESRHRLLAHAAGTGGDAAADH